MILIAAIYLPPAADIREGKIGIGVGPRVSGMMNSRSLAIQVDVGAKLSIIVPQFVIERDVPGAGALSENQIREVSLRSLQVLNEMGPKIQWLHSYVTEDKLYCVYLAPDEDTVREHARRTGIPANRVAAVRRLIGPATFK